MSEIWNRQFNKKLDKGAPGNQAHWGIFYYDDRRRLTRLTDAEGNEISFNPETQEMNFIGQETASEIIKAYKVSFGKEIAIFKGNPNFEYFYNFAKYRPTGENANIDLVIAQFFYEEENTAGHNKYLAWALNVTATIDTANLTDSKISMNFSQNGDLKQGVIFRTDSNAAEGEETYGFTSEDDIPVTSMKFYDGQDNEIEELELGVGEEVWLGVEFTPLGCPYGFTVDVSDPSVVKASKKRQSVVITARKAGTANVTVKSEGAVPVTKVIEVEVQ